MKSIQSAEKEVLDFCKSHGWETDPYKDLALLSEEVGELAREVRRIEVGRERPDEVEDSHETMISHLGEEVGDILFPLIKLCNHYGLTLEQCFQMHMDKLNNRYTREEEV